MLSIFFVKNSQIFEGDSTWGHKWMEDAESSPIIFHYDVYQSSDFPHVFLGGEYEQDEVIAKTGHEICETVDVRDLPEFNVWTKQEFDAVNPVFDLYVENLVHLISTKKCPIYVHCAMGANRSVSVLCAAISYLTGRSIDDVLGEMKLQRAFVAPHDPYYLMALEWSEISEEEFLNRYRMLDKSLVADNVNNIKTSQIPASSLPLSLWYHGTDSRTAYNLMSEMLLKPRRETGNTSYTGSLSSIPTAVYLTLNPGIAAGYAIERSSHVKGVHPVVLVIKPEDLGHVHIDEDLVHSVLNGHYVENVSQKVIDEIFSITAEDLRLDSENPSLTDYDLVMEYFNYRRMHGGNEDIDDEFFEEEGIVPDDSGDFEYDEVMHLAKSIANSLNNEHQQDAILTFQKMAHLGKVRVHEIYLIPRRDKKTRDDSGLSLKSYEELRRYGTRIDPEQLLMPFMISVAVSNWLIKSSQKWRTYLDIGHGSSDICWVLNNSGELETGYGDHTQK